MLSFRYVFKDFEKEEFLFKMWTLEDIEKGVYKTFTQAERNINLDKYSVDLVSPYTDRNGIRICVNDKILCVSDKGQEIFIIGWDGDFYCSLNNKLEFYLKHNGNYKYIKDCEIIGNIYNSE